MAKRKDKIMVYGLFDQDDNHVYTYEYGRAKEIAEKMAKVLKYYITQDLKVL